MPNLLNLQAPHDTDKRWQVGGSYVSPRVRSEKDPQLKGVVGAPAPAAGEGVGLGVKCEVCRGVLQPAPAAIPTAAPVLATR